MSKKTLGIDAAAHRAGRALQRVEARGAEASDHPFVCEGTTKARGLPLTHWPAQAKTLTSIWRLPPPALCTSATSHTSLVNAIRLGIVSERADGNARSVSNAATLPYPSQLGSISVILLPPPFSLLSPTSSLLPPSSILPPPAVF